MSAPPELPRCRDVAVELAHAAGAELLAQRRRGGLRVHSKSQRRELVTAADRAAEEIVVGGLLQQFPEHAVLAEEGVLTPVGRSSSTAESVWIVDPLDGTTNFVHGLPFFAVAIGLVQAGRPVVGVVHAPALGETFVATAGGGAERRFADGRSERLQVTATTELADALLATGFSYVRNEPGRDDNSGRLAKVLPLCRDLRRLGSAELDLCLVAAGSYDGYWELYLQPYDVAAGALIVREAGGRVTDLRCGDDWLFGGQVLASNGVLHDALRAVVGDHD
ncbi:MAG: inositol monophosphatase [Planctomycetes bacterium]|nr:inositol monophosphatase [Planctomycetota bacterium]MCB9887235.1 inositol monophosphatase [Planctomycetota bacterium]